MRKLIDDPSALPGLALRIGLAWVLFGWGYDIYFNPDFYAHSFGTQPTMASAVCLGLGVLLATGLATRLVAPAVCVALIVLGVKFVGHQPIGLPQDVGVAAAAAALWLIGPGALALSFGNGPASPGDLKKAGAILRIGLASTFLVYGVQKFTSDSEYRVVVSEIPALVALLGSFRPEAVSAFLGVLEILVGIAMLAPPLVTTSAVAQAAMLLGLVATVGYPFSYPQDIGLLGAEIALVVVTLGAGLRVRRSGADATTEPGLGVIPRRRQSDWGAPETAGEAVRRAS